MMVGVRPAKGLPPDLEGQEEAEAVQWVGVSAVEVEMGLLKNLQVETVTPVPPQVTLGLALPSMTPFGSRRSNQTPSKGQNLY